MKIFGTGKREERCLKWITRRFIICTLYEMAGMGRDEKCIQRAPRRKSRDWEDNFIRLLKAWVLGVRGWFSWLTIKASGGLL
jgi:hypothetical protein